MIMAFKTKQVKNEDGTTSEKMDWGGSVKSTLKTNAAIAGVGVAAVGALALAGKIANWKRGDQ